MNRIGQHGDEQITAAVFAGPDVTGRLKFAPAAVYAIEPTSYQHGPLGPAPAQKAEKAARLLPAAW